MGYPHWKDLKKTKGDTQTIEQFVQAGVEYIAIPDGAGHYFKLAVLTTAQRDALSPTNGMLIYNSTTNQFERYQAGGWGAFGAAGATTFLGLTDTLGSYSGQSGKIATVKATEDGLEFGSGGAGDMLKSVYDTDDDGVVDNSEKLEGSTKAQVQDHNPKAHAPSHEDLGGDEISVAGLSGELADLQKVKDHTHQSAGGGVGGKLDHGLALNGLGDDDHSQYLLADGSREASKIVITDGAGHFLQVSQLTTAQRDALSPVNGMIIYNSTTSQFERYENGGWGAFGGGSFDFFDKFRELMSFVSLDGFTTTVDTGGQCTASGHNLYFKTGDVSGRKAYLYAKCDIYRLVETGKVTTVEWVLYSLTITVANCVIHLFECQNINAPPTETDNHFGFKIINGDLYASNGDNVTQKITDTLVNIASSSQHTVLRVVVTQGTDVKFYVNGVLKITHTDNLPAAGQYRLNAGFTTNEDASKYMRIGRVAYERDR